jgi:hypothetical protein
MLQRRDRERTVGLEPLHEKKDDGRPRLADDLFLPDRIDLGDRRLRLFRLVIWKDCWLLLAEMMPGDLEEEKRETH